VQDLKTIELCAEFNNNNSCFAWCKITRLPPDAQGAFINTQSVMRGRTVLPTIDRIYRYEMTIVEMICANNILIKYVELIKLIA